MKKYVFIIPVMYCVYLFIINVAFAQNSPLNLSVKQYPNLVYTSKKINVSRDLFNTENAPTRGNKKVESEQILQPTKFDMSAINELENDKANNQLGKSSQCHKWSKTFVYLGTFSSAGENAVIIQNSQSKITKVKVGEFIAEQQLTLQKITKTKLVTTNTNSSICMLNRLTY